MEKIHSDLAPKAIGPYSQAIRVGCFLYISGQLPLLAETNTLVEGIEAQSEQVCKNISYILAEAGLNFSHVVKTTCFLADMQDFTIFNEVYQRYFTSKPARSCVAVSALPRNALCEVEVLAYIPES